MGAVWAVAKKDLLLLGRDRMGLFWALGFPLLMALFFGVISGGGGKRGKISITVDDRAQSPASQAFVAGLSRTTMLGVERGAEPAGRDAVRLGRRTAILVISPEMATIEIGIDPARKAEAGILRGIVEREVLAGLMQRDPALAQAWRAARPPTVTMSDVRPEAAAPASAFEVSFPSGIMWGVLGAVATFAIAVVTEREKGTLARLRVAPIGRAHVLAGKALACFLACVGVTAVLVVIAHFVFEVRIESPGLFTLGAVCTALCFVGLMMLLSILGKTERAVAGAAWGTMLPMSMLGGGMIPLVAMPAWMQTVSHVSPVRWGIVALEGAIWRGFGLADMLGPCAVLLSIGAAGFGVGAWMFAREDT
jgi:ABC-2 type transport system permease protein